MVYISNHDYTGDFFDEIYEKFHIASVNLLRTDLMAIPCLHAAIATIDHNRVLS